MASESSSATQVCHFFYMYFLGILPRYSRPLTNFRLPLCVFIVFLLLAVFPENEFFTCAHKLRMHSYGGRAPTPLSPQRNCTSVRQDKFCTSQEVSLQHDPHSHTHTGPPLTLTPLTVVIYALNLAGCCVFGWRSACRGSLRP